METLKQKQITDRVKMLRRQVDKGEISLSKYEDMFNNSQQEIYNGNKGIVPKNGVLIKPTRNNKIGKRIPAGSNPADTLKTLKVKEGFINYKVFSYL